MHLVFCWNEVKYSCGCLFHIWVLFDCFLSCDCLFIAHSSFCPPEFLFCHCFWFPPLLSSHFFSPFVIVLSSLNQLLVLLLSYRITLTAPNNSALHRVQINSNRSFLKKLTVGMWNLGDWHPAPVFRGLHFLVLVWRAVVLLSCTC